MSVSALQRLFRAARGTSVFDYYRGLRMERGRALLEQDRVGVMEASHIADYSNPANFATAFKRRFAPVAQGRARPHPHRNTATKRRMVNAT